MKHDIPAVERRLFCDGHSAVSDEAQEAEAIQVLNSICDMREHQTKYNNITQYIDPVVERGIFCKCDSAVSDEAQEAEAIQVLNSICDMREHQTKYNNIILACSTLYSKIPQR